MVLVLPSNISYAACLGLGLLGASLNQSLLSGAELTFQWAIRLVSDMIIDERNLSILGLLILVTGFCCIHWSHQKELARMLAVWYKKEAEERLMREKAERERAVREEQRDKRQQSMLMSFQKEYREELRENRRKEEERALRQEAMVMTLQKQYREELQEVRKRDEERLREIVEMMEIQAERRAKDRQASEEEKRKEFNRIEELRRQDLEEFREAEEQRWLEILKLREKEEEKRAEEEARFRSELIDIKKRAEKRREKYEAKMLLKNRSAMEQISEYGKMAWEFYWYGSKPKP